MSGRLAWPGLSQSGILLDAVLRAPIEFSTI